MSTTCPVPILSRWLRYVPKLSRWLRDVPKPSRWLRDVPKPSRWLRDVPKPSRWLRDVPKLSRWLRDVPKLSRWLRASRGSRRADWNDTCDNKSQIYLSTSIDAMSDHTQGGAELRKQPERDGKNIRIPILSHTK